ncbi:MAG: 30S ribosomal protein S2 [Candidatus Vogelbacteria bacterium CG10_big_fil_rev_8_21_14_0_10_45_14]|uniref:Small ribosomal subunit protein uS2 n=1 Tax=Candidatus Vogelbacteria bacterium CG10_big_fil_rev_8_21_14_0_10_45_14 TaxID=1975042 RepID=A0A2H0RIW1_9BACT|nr:MAG: 30S ribosomal protein S2 [Candidatus Vogelbacteria bacterium CG10_big_fil_rev_8_21_14_0_10_45_14]
MIETEKQDVDLLAGDPAIEAMFKVGAHFGYKRTRRHPTTGGYVFGVKNNVEIIDLEKTKTGLDEAVNFVKRLAAEGKTLLFVGNKKESQEAVREAALSVSMPYVSNRWIGGTLTNWSEIKKRLLRLEDLSTKKEKGELSIYTKRERVMIDRDIQDLERLFGGIRDVRSVPHALFVVDPREEETAVREATRLKIPVVALASTDCDVSLVTHAIVANDSSRSSIGFFVGEIAKAFAEGRSAGLPKVEERDEVSPEADPKEATIEK